MALARDEARPIRDVTAILVADNGDKKLVDGTVVVFMDPDTATVVHTSSEFLIDRWEIRVHSDGMGYAEWRGPLEETPGLAEWRAMESIERVTMLLQSVYGPGDLGIQVEPLVTEMGVQWKACLQRIGLGHLYLPQTDPPPMEDL